MRRALFSPVRDASRPVVGATRQVPTRRRMPLPDAIGPPLLHIVAPCEPIPSRSSDRSAANRLTPPRAGFKKSPPSTRVSTPCPAVRH
jgi:hypothetical protein